MKSYKNLGICFLRLKMYKMSIRYFGKFLACAWYNNNVDSELLAYDYLGVGYFYEGDLDKAQYYHQKMIYGKNIFLTNRIL